MKEGLLYLAIIALGLWFISEITYEDKYIMRDECVFHKTQEWTGDGVSINYTPVTCDTSKFHEYHIEP